MKKFLVFGLILAIAGGAFAQSFTIGGGISTGLAVEWNEDAVDARLRFPSDHDGIQINLTGDAINAAGTVGANFALRWDNIILVARDDTGRDGEAYIGYLPYVKRANVWVALVPNVMRVSLGIGGPGGFGTPGPLNKSLNVATGDLNVTMLINPVPQVTIGATVNLPPIDTRIDKDTWSFDEDDIFISLGARVNLENAANVAFNFSQNLKEKTVDMAAGFDILALRVVTFGFDAALIDFFGAKDFSLGQSVNLNIGNFEANFNARQFLELGSDDPMVMLFDTNVQYSFGAVTPRLGYGLGINTTQPIPRQFYDELKPADALINKASDPDAPYWAMVFNPNVLFNFGPSELEIGFSIYYDFVPTLYNVLYLGYKYNF